MRPPITAAIPFRSRGCEIRFFTCPSAEAGNTLLKDSPAPPDRDCPAPLNGVPSDCATTVLYVSAGSARRCAVRSAGLCGRNAPGRRNSSLDSRDVALDARPHGPDCHMPMPRASDALLRISFLSHRVLHPYPLRETGYVTPRHLHPDKRSSGLVRTWSLLGG